VAHIPRSLHAGVDLTSYPVRGLGFKRDKH
jgi:hypothetical protein